MSIQYFSCNFLPVQFISLERISHNLRSSEMYTNNNLTDEAAERYLAENPKGIVFFASTPSDWEKRVERRMSPALPLDETLVSELVKAFEVEGATSEIVRDA